MGQIETLTTDPTQNMKELSSCLSCVRKIRRVVNQRDKKINFVLCFTDEKSY